MHELCRVIELTGDVTPDMRAVGQADLIVTTPEKWDGISRSWQTRSYVKSVVLLVIDEIHLLGKRYIVGVCLCAFILWLFLCTYIVVVCVSVVYCDCIVIMLGYVLVIFIF